MSCPPSSYPTYPGGAPTSLETLCFSMYSDISILMIFRSESNNASDKALASSVLPTPVGPKNINEPIGLFSAFKPALALKIAWLTASIPSSWPMTLLCKIFGKFKSLSFSLSTNFDTGTPVHCETTSAISSSETSSFKILCSFASSASAFAASSSFSFSGSVPYFSDANFSKS